MKDHVSIWIGNFTSEEELVEYTTNKYTNDGDSIPSIFEKDFSLSYYDRDGVEKGWASEHANSIKELLGGFSYSDQFLGQIDNMGCSEKFNCAILIYNMKYDVETTKGQYKNNEMRFYDVAVYEDSPDDRW
ncbi:immunity 22 family protein [Rossellomorea marisflavi]|uniref:immunity 22 family protein n=1 Tax=Rossellomorea marisflavi TaxID=189381 RepID=UPI0025AF09D6|nr:immunity 22 family protein [Rossellomorea marisflavi]WJV19379.1 immunity 22 family protein [Rossellomorea marisflavi]